MTEQAKTLITSKLQLGFNPVVVYDSIAKRLKECMLGSTGLAALELFLDQIDFVPELGKYRNNIKSRDLYFATAHQKCGKEKLNRPSRVREEEIFKFMGYRCSCGATVSSTMIDDVGYTCRCGGTYTEVYVDVLEELIEKFRVDVDGCPEAVLMYHAHQKLADAYWGMFQAVRCVLQSVGKLMGWGEKFHINSSIVQTYFDQLFLGYMPGETKINREERQLLMFLVRGNVEGGVALDRAEKLIRLGCEAVGWGFLFNQLGCAGADAQYSRAEEEYMVLYTSTLEEIRLRCVEVRAEHGKTRVAVLRLPAGEERYYPCVRLPEEAWINGRLPSEVHLQPVLDMDIYPRPTDESLTCFYALPGHGKSFSMSANVSEAYLRKRELIVNILADKSNSFTLASLPAFSYDKRTEKFVAQLRYMGVEPQAIPTLTITVLQRDEEVKSPKKANPPTIFDRRLIVDNYKSFTFDWSWALRELRKIAVDYYGYTGDKPVGLINFRNLDRQNTLTKEEFDVQVAICLLPQFDSFRKDDPKYSCRLLCDEASQIAPASTSNQDLYESGMFFKKFVKETRRNNCSIDTGSQQINDLLTEIRNTARNIFWMDLPTDKDKNKSQIESVLGSLQLEDDSVLEVVRQLNKKGTLNKGHFWFHYNRRKVPRKIEVVRFCPPTFMVQDPSLNLRDVFKEYEKLHPEPRILLDSWDQVPFVNAGRGQYEKKAFKARI